MNGKQNKKKENEQQKNIIGQEVEENQNKMSNLADEEWEARKDIRRWTEGKNNTGTVLRQQGLEKNTQREMEAWHATQLAPLTPSLADPAAF